MRRIVLISLIALAVLFVGVAGIGWYLLEDEAFLKSQLSKLAMEYTGRELRFDGPLNLDLGGTTTLEGREIHFANAAWSEHPDMVSVGRIFISFDLSTLFDDRPVFPDAQLEECRVYVERNFAGELNWSLGSGAPVEEEPEALPDEQEPRNLPVWLKHLDVSDCELHVISYKIEEPLHLRLSSLEMKHHDDSRWSATGSGDLNEMPLSIDGWFAPFGSFIYGGQVDHEVRIAVGEMSLVSSGSVRDVLTGTGANLAARLQGPAIENVLNEFRLPLFTRGDFDFTLKLNTEGDMTRIDLDGDLGSLEATADGELDRLIGPSAGNVQMAIDGPNLGALARIFGVEGLVEEAFSHRSHAVIEGDRIHIREGSLQTSGDHLQLGGHFSLAPGFAGSELDVGFRTGEAGRWTTALGRGEQEIGAFELDSRLTVDGQGLIAVDGLAKLQQTELQLAGTLGSLPEAIRPQLDVSLNSPNARPLASIWGLTEFPEQPFSVNGRLGIDGSRLDLGEFDVRLAASSAQVDGTLNLGGRFAGSDIQLDLNIANAARLGELFGREGLPDQPIQLTAEIRPDGDGLAFRVDDGALGEIKLDLDGRIPDLQQPMGITGNFDIYLPRLGDVSFLAPGVELPDAPFTAQGRLVTEEGVVNLNGVHADLQGHRATIDGHINLGRRYAGSQLTFDLDIKNARELGLLFGQEDFPDQPIKLTASVEPLGKGLAFRIDDGAMGDVKVDLDGSIADLDQPTGVDAEFDISLTNLRHLDFLIPNRQLPAVPFAARGRLVNEQSRTKLDEVRLSLGEVRAFIDGDFKPDQSFQLAIRASGPDASRLESLAGTGLPPEPFEVTTALQGNPGAFELRDTRVVLGRSEARGNLRIGLGDHTLIHGNVVSPYLDVSYWDTIEETPEDPSADDTPGEWMFDQSPVKVLGDHGLDIDLDLKADTLVLSNTTLKELDVHFVMAPRLVRVSPFAVKGIEGGTYNGHFSLDGTRGRPRLDVDVKGENVRLGLAAAEGQDPQTYPPIEIDIDIDGKGATRRELASSLDGKLRIYQGAGQLANTGMDFLFNDFLTQLFSQLNPFAEESEFTKLDCAVYAANVESGVIKAAPLLIHTEQLTILSEGTVDLNTENIDLSFNTKPRTGLGLSPGMVINPLIKVGGRLTTPSVEIDPASTLTTGGLAVATVGISLLAKSMADRFLSSPDPCGDARKELEKYDAGQQ